MTDVLTEDEEVWISNLANLIYVGYSCSRNGLPPLEIRSGVYRGVISELVKLTHRHGSDAGHDLFDLGAEAFLGAVPKPVY